MKWAPLLTLVLIGLVAGDGAWKLNRVYNYQLQSKAFIASRQSSNGWLGVVSRARLTIHPQSNDVLIGQISGAEYAEITERVTDVSSLNWNSREFAFVQWPLNKPFKMLLRNGAISSLAVDSRLTNEQINQLKVIASQFQVDTSFHLALTTTAGRALRRKDDRLTSQYNSWFKKMETLATGSCETTYEISPLPDYMNSHRDLVPLPELREQGEFMEIVKTRNVSNCNIRGDYHLDMAAQSDFKIQMNRDLLLSEVTRMVISGTLGSFTLQSSTTTSKVAASAESAALYDYIKVTLQSVEQSNLKLSMGYGSMMNVGSMMDVGNLIFEKRNIDPLEHVQLRKSINLSPLNIMSKVADRIFEVYQGQEKWTGCWTLFPALSTLCKSEFSAEWDPIDTKSCGFLGLGRAAKCRHTYPGCEATPCYTAFIPRSELCDRTFGKRLPVTKGGFEDCSPGFYRSRCCPR